MATTDTATRVIVRCQDCRAIVGGQVGADGSITPIGTERNCACGSDSFERLR